MMKAALQWAYERLRPATMRRRNQERPAHGGMTGRRTWTFASGIAALIAFQICAPSLLSTQAPLTATRPAQPAAPVPFAGCKSDGQAGPVDAPSGKAQIAPVTPEAAERLAYYKAAQGFGVLAPRGWYCFGTYGSSGSTLFVSPQPLSSADVFSKSWKGFAGPAIQVSISVGDTSGRFAVAKTIARVFPAHRAFVTSVIAEGIEPASSFPAGPYPQDKLTYRSKEMIEYETPAETPGLGTESYLRKNGDAISGVAMLTGPELTLVQLAMRLPPELKDLAPIVVQQVERDAR
jgi:hypothetical protein